MENLKRRKREKKWRKVENDNCRICNEQETIKHMLYSCTSSFNVWQEFYRNTDIYVSFQDIIIGCKSKTLNVYV